MINNLLFNLLVAHIVGDFYLQWSMLCKNKVIKSIKGKALWAHALMIGGLSVLVTWDVHAWWLGLAVMISHLLIDWLKSYLQLKYKILTKENSANNLVAGENKRHDLWLFIIDQIAHLCMLFLLAKIWLIENNDWQQFAWLQDFATNHPLRLNIIAAMLLVLKPANVLILQILATCKVNAIDDNHGNFHSGELIGWLERGLILLFVVMSQYEAIGFLVAAKSILRFSETSHDEKSEYVLTGTLLSLAISLCLGIAVIKM